MYKVKCKGKVHPMTSQEGPEVEYRYSSTLSLTTALYRDRWSTPHSGRFTPLERGTVPTVQVAGWSRGPVRTGA